MKGVRTRLWLARLELSVTSLRAAASHRQPAAPICKHLTPKTSRHTLEQSQQRAASHPHRRPSPRPSPKGANLCSPRARAGARRGRQISRGYWTWILRKPVFEPPPGFNLPQRSSAFQTTSSIVRARFEPPHPTFERVSNHLARSLASVEAGWGWRGGLVLGVVEAAGGQEVCGLAVHISTETVRAAVGRRAAMDPERVACWGRRRVSGRPGEVSTGGWRFAVVTVRGGARGGGDRRRPTATEW